MGSNLPLILRPSLHVGSKWYSISRQKSTKSSRNWWRRGARFRSNWSPPGWWTGPTGTSDVSWKCFCIGCLDLRISPRLDDDAWNADCLILARLNWATTCSKVDQHVRYHHHQIQCLNRKDYEKPRIFCLSVVFWLTSGTVLPSTDPWSRC